MPLNNISPSNPPEGLQSRFNTTYTVSYPQFPSFTSQPIQIVLRQEAMSHDVMVLKYVKQNDFFSRGLKTGSPVKVEWENNKKAKGSFYGYVMSYKRTKATQSSHEMEVRCIGTSLPLKDTVSNIWRNKTIPEIVNEIAKKNKLKAVVTSHPARHSQIAMFGQSYWEFLQELAYKVGYVCWVENSTIYFISFNEQLKRNLKSIPLLNFQDEFVPAFSNWIERTLDKFEPILGDLVENEEMPVIAVKNITGVDPLKPKSYASSTSPKTSLKKEGVQVIFQDNSSFDVANSKQFADSLTKAKAERAKWAIPGRFYGQGDPRISPYKYIEISGIDETTDGYWLVHSVTHSIGRDGTYFADGLALTDGRGPTENPQKVSPTGKPALNLEPFGEEDLLGSQTKPSLDSNYYMYNQASSGYAVTPQRWL